MKRALTAAGIAIAALALLAGASLLFLAREPVTRLEILP